MKTTKHYFTLLTILIFVLSWNASGQVKPQETDKPDYTFRNEFVTMEDGVKLSTDVYLPAQKGEFPCILIRTPYNMKGLKASGEWFAKNGFAVVAQDCRGKYLSQGDFYAFRNERCDGLVTVKWIRRQPWSNGKIGGWGGSYLGYTQWAVSDKLDALTPNITGADLYGLIYPDGLFSTYLAFRWGFSVDAKMSNVIPPEKLSASFLVLPMSVADDVTYKDSRFIDDWLSHPLDDAYWKYMNHQGITTSPVLSVSGWYDIFLMVQIADFQALREKGHSDSRLVIGPWCHGSQAFKNEYGGREKTGDTGTLMQRFLAKHLKGEGVKLMAAPFKDKKYNLFIMERNEYYGSDQWPPKDVSYTNYYIGPNKYLSPQVLQHRGKLEYTYDPANPYPSKGGTSIGEAVGPALQNDNLSRADQVAFETDVLKSPLTLLGPISATLYVSCDAPSTDFIVCLQDVFPDGKIVNIQEGGATVCFEKSGVKEIELSVWAAGYQLNRGHKLRAVITSSWFPRFNRNLNSAEPIFSAKTIKIAHQKIHFGPKHSSSITLPILKLKD